jgi:superfamily II DNA or RNA helicase
MRGFATVAPAEAPSVSPLRNVAGIQPIYFVPREDLAAHALVPCLKKTKSVDCMIGFFSSQSLSILAPGLASFIENSKDALRLVICPVIRPEDRDAIRDGYCSADRVIEDFLGAALAIEDALVKHTLRCLTYLISAHRIEIKVALMRDAIFHPKVWLLSDGNDTIAIHGSSNLTLNGLSKNFEQVSVTKSWADETSKYVVQKLQLEFETIWSRKSTECFVYDFPEALSRRLLRDYSGGGQPTEGELLALLESNSEAGTSESCKFQIPTYLNYTTGDFAHQGAAVDALEANNFRGVLAMATGSGKTITAMIAAHRLFQRERKLLIVVAAPYLPLISQWCDEITDFGLAPLNLGLIAGADARNNEIARIGRRIRMSAADTAEAVVITHKTLCDPDFQAALGRLGIPIFLIGDEVHNLGAAGFIGAPPEAIQYRLGLSATPVRQYDPEGTQALFAYFGPTVFSFTLEQAIGICLVPYDYYIHPVSLTDAEVEQWIDLTEKIKKELRKNPGLKVDENPILQMLLQRRRLILESAEGKLDRLSRLLHEHRLQSLAYTLIYATDKDPEQLNRINDLLRGQNIRFHQITAQETSSRDLTRLVIEAFERRDLQVLTAKRVLDEGVNIPQISQAYILASTTVERQWVQRRGRLLRKCKAIQKQSSTIHDFLVVPPSSYIDSDAKAIVKAELRRVREFARLSLNFGAEHGALEVIDPIIRDFFLDPEEVYAVG